MAEDGPSSAPGAGYSRLSDFQSSKSGHKVSGSDAALNFDQESVLGVGLASGSVNPRPSPAQLAGRRVLSPVLPGMAGFNPVGGGGTLVLPAVLHAGGGSSAFSAYRGAPVTSPVGAQPDRTSVGSGRVAAHPPSTPHVPQGVEGTFFGNVRGDNSLAGIGTKHPGEAVVGGTTPLTQPPPSAAVRGDNLQLPVRHSGDASAARTTPATQAPPSGAPAIIMALRGLLTRSFHGETEAIAALHSVAFEGGDLLLAPVAVPTAVATPVAATVEMMESAGGDSVSSGHVGVPSVPGTDLSKVQGVPEVPREQRAAPLTRELPQPAPIRSYASVSTSDAAVRPQFRPTIVSIPLASIPNWGPAKEKLLLATVSPAGFPTPVKWYLILPRSRTYEIGFHTAEEAKAAAQRLRALEGGQAFPGASHLGDPSVDVTLIHCHPEIPESALRLLLSQYGSVGQFLTAKSGVLQGALTGTKKVRMVLQSHIPPMLSVPGYDEFLVRYYQQPPGCRECGSSGHGPSDCPSRRCRGCGEQGHIMASCPRVRCYKCGQQGHFAKGCTTPLTCGICKGQGHKGSACPNRPKAQRVPIQSIEWVECGDDEEILRSVVAMEEEQAVETAMLKMAEAPESRSAQAPRAAALVVAAPVARRREASGQPGGGELSDDEVTLVIDSPASVGSAGRSPASSPSSGMASVASRPPSSSASVVSDSQHGDDDGRGWSTPGSQKKRKAAVSSPSQPAQLKLKKGPSVPKPKNA